MITLSKEDMLKAKRGQKPDFLCQIVNAEKMFLKEIKSVNPVTTWVIMKVQQSIADVEKLLVVWTEDQTSHNIPLSQSPIQSKALTPFNSVKAERGLYEANRDWLILKEANRDKLIVKEDAV